MDALPISLEARPFQGLLNGLMKKNFYGDREITREYLLSELYANREEAEQGQFANEISLYEKVCCNTYVMWFVVEPVWLTTAACVTDCNEGSRTKLGTRAVS
jgi:hypothetical protein